jgi:ribosomal protein L33
MPSLKKKLLLEMLKYPLNLKLHMLHKEKKLQIMLKLL